MKFAVLIGGGMPDEALEVLENRSPLEAANVPNLDRIAAEGRTGLVQSIPAGVEPTSESAAGTFLGSGHLLLKFAVERGSCLPFDFVYGLLKPVQQVYESVRVEFRAHITTYGRRQGCYSCRVSGRSDGGAACGCQW